MMTVNADTTITTVQGQSEAIKSPHPKAAAHLN